MNSRMYENEYPDVGDIVYVKVKSVSNTGAYVSLLEYNDIEGMILMSDLSRRRVKCVSKLLSVNKTLFVSVIRVDKVRGYVDVSKKVVDASDIPIAEEKWNKSKLVHAVFKQMSLQTKIDLLELYTTIGWPLYTEYGHAYDAFELFLSNPSLIPDDWDVLIDIIKKKMPRQVNNIKTNFELTCFEREGINAIKSALQAGVDESKTYDNASVSISLIASPMYTINVECLDETYGLDIVQHVFSCIESVIKKYDGNMVIKSEAQTDIEVEI